MMMTTTIDRDAREGCATTNTKTIVRGVLDEIAMTNTKTIVHADRGVEPKRTTAKTRLILIDRARHKRFV